MPSATSRTTATSTATETPSTGVPWRRHYLPTSRASVCAALTRIALGNRSQLDLAWKSRGPARIGHEILDEETSSAAHSQTAGRFEIFWRAQHDSNVRPPGPQPDALSN